MIGQRFTRLVVTAEAERIFYATTSSRRYVCKCDCGSEIFATPSNLKRGGTKSCGCLKKETAGAHVTTHGMSGSDEYKIWCGIIKRCNKETNGSHLYKDRGIAVCQRWLDFASFYADMGPRPSSLHSVDRIDNDGGYEPGNCRWATPKQQSLNSRRVRKVLYQGEEMSVRQFAKELGHSYWSVYAWVVRRGLSTDQVLQKVSSL